MANKVLIVDDYAAMRALVRRILAHHLPGVELLECSSAAAALACLDHESPCAAIVDTVLPDLSGIETAHRIAAMQPGCAIIVHADGDEPWWEQRTRAAAVARMVVRKGDCEGLIEAARRLLTV